ncbi:hypothetical protein D3C71_1665040 [compost metagenome]
MLKIGNHLLNQQMGKRHNQIVFLCHRDEYVRRNIAVNGVAPAGEHLDTGDLPRLCIDEGLIKRSDMTLSDSRFQGSQRRVDLRGFEP